MFTKVLIADDIDFNDLAAQILRELNVARYTMLNTVMKLVKIKAAQDHQPYQLLISDLSFKADHNKTTLAKN
jgi:hypothetical protein